MGNCKKNNKPATGKKHDLNAELFQALNEMKRGKWARKTEFFPKPDGSIRRVITRRDGTVEKNHIIKAKKALYDSLVRARKIRLSFGEKTFSDSADLLREDRGQ